MFDLCLSAIIVIVNDTCSMTLFWLVNDMWNVKKKIYAVLLVSAALMSLVPSVSAVTSSLPVESSVESTVSEVSADESSTPAESSVSETTSSEPLESSYSESSYEASEYTESSYTESSYEETHSESSYQSSQNEESYIGSESRTESADESSLESSRESSEESSEEESSEEESSREESSEAVTEIFENDPLKRLDSLATVLPADKEGYISPKQESEKILAEESDKAAAAAILSAPPIPYEDTTKKYISEAEKNADESMSFLTGIIIWSVIGVIITAALIIILRSTDNGKITRSRYKSRSVIRRNGKQIKIKSKYLK